jgi:hypothetical protein
VFRDPLPPRRGYFFECDCEASPDPCGTVPVGACTVLPPGAGSGAEVRGLGDGAGEVGGASPGPEDPGAMEAGFGDCASACAIVIAETAPANASVRTVFRIIDWLPIR